jgi:spermidine/putrescine-binding protein
MTPTTGTQAVATLAAFSMLLGGCGGRAPAAGSPPATQRSVPSGKITSSGFDCPEPVPRSQLSTKELNIYTWTTYVPTDFIECFQLVYEAKVKHDEYSSMEEMSAAVEADPTAYDLIQPTDFAVTPLIRKGQLAPLDHNRLAVLANFSRHYLNLPYDPGNRYTVPYENGTDAILVNADKVKNVPKSWSDLWNSEFTGRIVAADDERAIIGLTLLTLGYDVNTTDAGELEQSRRALMLLSPNIKEFDSDSPHSRLLAGEVDLGETWTGEAFLAQLQMPSALYVYPTEGAILWQDNWALLKQARNADAAYAWINYTMQADMFWMMLTNFPYTNPNDAALAYAKGNPMQVTDVNGTVTTLAAVYNAYVNSTTTNPPPEVIRAGHRIDDVGTAVELYDKIWAELMSGR